MKEIATLKRLFSFWEGIAIKSWLVQRSINAEKGEDNSFLDKVTKLFTQRMSYRIYDLVSNACDEMAVKCNSQLFREEAGEHKQFMIQSDYNMQEDKKKIKMPVEDTNTAFSLGLWQKMGQEE